MPSPHRANPSADSGCPESASCGIRRDFSRLSRCGGQVAYVLLTRAPVAGGCVATAPLPLDLHVLSLSLAFILSQDQTLRCCISSLFFSLKKQNVVSVLLSPCGALAPLCQDAVSLTCLELTRASLFLGSCTCLVYCNCFNVLCGFSAESFAKVSQVFESCKFLTNFLFRFCYHFRPLPWCFSKASAKVEVLYLPTKYFENFFLHFFFTKFVIR